MTLGEAIERFYWTHGDEDTWTPAEVVWHDILCAATLRENGERHAADDRQGDS